MNRIVYEFFHYFSQFAPTLFQTNRDSFQLEFENGNMYFECEIKENQYITCLFENKNTDDYYESTFVCLEDVKRFFEMHYIPRKLT